MISSQGSSEPNMQDPTALSISQGRRDEVRRCLKSMGDEPEEVEDVNDSSSESDGEDGCAAALNKYVTRANGEIVADSANLDPETREQLNRLSSVFHLPQKEAAMRWGMALSTFKKLCRRLGIRRWPYRKYRSIGNQLKRLT